MKKTKPNLLQAAFTAYKQLIGRAVKKQNPKLSQEQIDEITMNILIQNVFAQTPYTPQAKQQILNRNKFIYNAPNMTAEDEYDALGVYNARTQTIGINRRIIDDNPTEAADTFKHEVVHALDSNVNKQSSARYPLNSQGFSNNLQRVNPKHYKNQMEWHNSPNARYDNDQRTKDVEMFARVGTNPNSATKKLPKIDPFRDLYLPMTLAPLNYSPRFPTRETFIRNRPKGFPTPAEEF